MPLYQKWQDSSWPWFYCVRHEETMESIHSLPINPMCTLLTLHFDPFESMSLSFILFHYFYPFGEIFPNTKISPYCNRFGQFMKKQNSRKGFILFWVGISLLCMYLCVNVCESIGNWIWANLKQNGAKVERRV